MIATTEAAIHQYPVELLQNLIRFDTTNPPGNEKECIQYINCLLTEVGLETLLLGRSPQRPNLFSRLQGQGIAPPLLLYGHVDVVTADKQDWRYPPFSGQLVDGYVWGRGALDMKSGVAMMLAAFLRAKAEGLTPAGDVILAVLSDEEAGAHYGARYLAETHPDLFRGIRYALGELGGFTLYFGGKKFYPIQVAEKQVCRILTTLRGPGGHGSMPLRGGAMGQLGHVLQRLDQQRLPVHITPVTYQFFKGMASALPSPLGSVPQRLLDPALTDQVLNEIGEEGRIFDAMLHNTITPTIVRGGKKINVIPSEVLLKLDGRLLPGYGPGDMVTELRQVIGDQVELALIRYDPGPPEPDMGLFPVLADVLREADPEGMPLPFLLPASTDARFFSQLGIQTYGFTPMILPEDINPLKFAHAANERIPVEAMAFGAEAIYKVLQRFRE